MDWDLIKQKPDKEHKIMGTLLLELKSKMELDQKTITELKAAIEKASIERKGIEEKHVAEVARAASLQGRVKELENNLLDRHKEISALKDEKAEIKKEAEVLTREQQIFTESINKSEERIKEAELRKEEADVEIKRLLGAISEKEAKTGELRGEIEGIKSALLATGDIKDSEIKQLYSEKDKIRAELEGKANELAKTIQGLEVEKAKLTSQLKDEKETVTKKDMQLKAAEEEKTTLRGTIGELKKQLKEKEVIIEAKDFDYFKNLRKEKASKVDKSSE
jgi:chromosome segregation ATPase